MSPLDGSTTFCLSINVHGHLGCLHLLAIVNIVAMNIVVQIAVQVPALNSLYTQQWNCWIMWEFYV